MTKRKFAAVALGTLLLFRTVPAVSADGYEEIIPPVAVETAEGQVQVLEYFWFGCPHCFAFEPTINKWKKDKPDYVEFVREAPPLNPGWLSHSQTFYAAEIMGVTEKIFEPFFNAIHIDRKNLKKPRDIADFVGEFGVDSEKFLATMDSFAVKVRIQQALHQASLSGISGVPAIVINGKYLTGNSLAGGHDGVVRVINKLVETERSGGS